MLHEAAHVSLDDRVEPDPEWVAAQKADGAYISKYAKSHPQREDVAESFLAYLAARYVPSRISRTWETTILQTIPNRIAYFDALLSAGDMKPFTRASLRVAANNPVSLSVSGNGAFADGGSALTMEAAYGFPAFGGRWTGRASTGSPVRAKSALVIAGASGGRPGSPTPVGGSFDGTICMSTGGMSGILGMTKMMLFSDAKKMVEEIVKAT